MRTHELDPETQSETTPRDSEGRPIVGFMEAPRLPPEFIAWVDSIRHSKGVKGADK